MWQYIGSTSGADTGVGGMSEPPEVLILGDEGMQSFLGALPQG